MKKGKVYIGTSGWHYKHWKGTFYPVNIKDHEQLEWYQRSFDTVEVNNSFYRLPDESTFEHWRNASPRHFIFSIKASRFITHMKKLKDGKSSAASFFSRVKALKNKTGPILFQLPPSWKINYERLSRFITELPRGFRYVFEFRNADWYQEHIFELLRSHRCAFCIYELAHHLSPEPVTADFVYVRLHGPGDKYQGSYTRSSLEAWALKIGTWMKKGLDVYVYFDNDEAGYAALNALELKKL